MCLLDAINFGGGRFELVFYFFPAVNKSTLTNELSLHIFIGHTELSLDCAQFFCHLVTFLHEHLQISELAPL
jgi:hypothetical protein